MGTDEVTLKQVLPFLDKVVEKDSISYEWIFFADYFVSHFFTLSSHSHGTTQIEQK